MPSGWTVHASRPEKVPSERRSIRPASRRGFWCALVAISALSFAAPFATARAPDFFASLGTSTKEALIGFADFSAARPRAEAFAGASPGDLARLSKAPSTTRGISVGARSIPVCSGGSRAKRKLTCIVDGDTGWQDGEKWRTAAIDTPEIDHAACPRERQLGLRARDRLRQLMSAGYSLSREGTGHYGRTLVTIILADGRDAGDVLIQEGLSQAWPNNGNPWCG